MHLELTFVTGNGHTVINYVSVTRCKLSAIVSLIKFVLIIRITLTILTELDQCV